jgi:hydroxyacylglutathione hydrolase
MIKATGARLCAHKNAKNSIEGIDVGLEAGDVVKVGNTVELLALDTPGHTMSHVCMLSQTETPALICGDTLFNAGAGNCHGGGHPNELYDTFASQLDKLPDNTLIYPGHDYITNNLQFTLDREPDNEAAASLLDELTASHDPESATVTSLAQEKEINTFFRLTSSTVIKRLRESFPDLGESPSPREVFVKLRELRNSW